MFRRAFIGLLIAALLISAAAIAESGVAVGDIVTFGSYEQDGDETNGAESIEWRVLDVDENGICLLISVYDIEVAPYNDSFAQVTWEDCSLRAWLNGTFYDTAFTDAEKQRIVITDVAADANTVYTTDPGADTRDMVYLLSEQEARAFFANDKDRHGIATPYAVQNGIAVNPQGESWYWLRTPGTYGKKAAYIYGFGGVFTEGWFVDIDFGGVRPVIRVNL